MSVSEIRAQLGHVGKPLTMKPAMPDLRTNAPPEQTSGMIGVLVTTAPLVLV